MESTEHLSRELQIVRGLRQLDPTLETTWTKAQTPSMDAVAQAVGFAVTRAELDRVVPGLTRDTFPELVDAKLVALGFIPTIPSAPDSQGDSASQTLDSGEYKPSLPQEAHPPTTTPQTLEREIAAHQRQLEQLEQTLHDTQLAYERVNAELDALLRTQAVVVPPLNPQEEYQRHVRIQHEQRIARQGAPTPLEQRFLAGRRPVRGG